MNRAFSIALLIAAALTLAGCVAPTYESESQYAFERTMTEQSVQRCRVLEWRQVDIGAQAVRSNYSRYGVSQNTLGPYASTGSALGGIAGAALADSLGSDNQYVILAAALAGATAGSHLGNKQDMKSPYRRGIEYSVIKSDGSELVITQPLAATDRIAPVGSTCRIVRSGSTTRVLPGEQLPNSLQAPMITRIR